MDEYNRLWGKVFLEVVDMEYLVSVNYFWFYIRWMVDNYMILNVWLFVLCNIFLFIISLL